MLSVSVPDNCRAERSWITSVLLGEFLGISYELHFDGKDTVKISADGKSLELPDTFFCRAKDNWLLRGSLPVEPLKRWPVADSGLDPVLVEPCIPVMFGDAGFGYDSTGYAILRLDIFGSAFFMLSRYEEAVCEQRDNHDRFPGTASLAYREAFLDRPLVDEYVEILWDAMHMTWPQLRRKSRRYRMVVTCDVDHPYHASARSFLRLLKRTVGETLHKHTITASLRPVKNYIASRNGCWKYDPYHPMIDWMMDENEKAGNKVAFYFIPETSDADMDGTCSITDPVVVDMMKRIAGRGHEIGIHPGYNTYQNKEKFSSGVNALRRMMTAHGISQQLLGGRQHYLRWSPRTPQFWDEAQLEYDSTLSYADFPGFRCGTCHEYAMYDLQRRTALEVRQRPLICMEASVISYMGYGVTESTLAKLNQLKATVQRFNGNFVLLWHNSSLETAGEREIYCTIIR